MMYVLTTDYDVFVFTTKDYLNDFLERAVLPAYEIKEVEPTPLYRQMAEDTWWNIRAR